MRGGTSRRWVVGCLFFAVGWTLVAQEPSEELKEMDRKIQTLTESLAVARTEAELFRKKWEEVRLRAEMLGVDFRSTDATRTQRKLVESLRALYLAEAENQRLVKQLERLMDAMEQGGDARTEMAHTKELLSNRAKGIVPEISAGKVRSVPCQVLEVNAELRMVVLNAGAEQGVRVGMSADVERNGKMIGRICVVEVRERICGALIENVESKVTLAAGDVARLPGVGNGF